MSIGRNRTFLALAALSVLGGCQSPTLIVLEDPRSYVEERSLRDARDDVRIRLDISSLYVEDPSSELTNIRVEVYENDVLLSGTVRSAVDKETAGALAASVENVGRLYNEIQVIEDASLADAAADLTIETKIKRGFRGAKEIHAANLRWHSVNGIVYLFGRALSEEERLSIIALAGKIDGVKQVVDRMKVSPSVNRD